MKRVGARDRRPALTATLLLAFASLLVIAGCGAALGQVDWTEFQTHVLDTMDGVEGDYTEGMRNVDFQSSMKDESAWAASVKANPCFEPALRAYREYVSAVIAVGEAWPAGLDIDDMSLQQLTDSRDALQSALDEYDRLEKAFELATGACS